MRWRQCWQLGNNDGNGNGNNEDKDGSNEGSDNFTIVDNFICDGSSSDDID